ncbi:histone H2A.Z-specific chaperone CHZ1-like [Lycium ferocissimum]|uniref:histone H2A.Z-specific chaperone CHZ1-like n=1 Tax=Lycium ferocissimum TaxID=112874 RepID=UPI00281537A0|nr:histone H2A.Z-specific chaperone CHZ1-like [Lycium ferocissimum]
MGCFLGCFGFTSKKQKRIKPCNKFQVHQKYVPLDSEKDNAADSPNSEPRDKHKPKESAKPKVKKKVSFNLDVKTYERIQDDDYNTTYFSEEEEKKTQWEYNEQETTKASMSMYPSSYRYYNCNNSYDDEEDELTLEESDIDDLDEDEDYGVSDEDDDGGGDEYNSLDIEKENKFGNVEKLNKDESNEVGQNHRNSVLLPVENLTQWKTIKARGAHQVKHQKENIIKLDGKQELPLIDKPPNHFVDLNPKNNSKPKPQGHEISVDASLSNWLTPRKTSVNGSAVYCIEDTAKDQVVLDEVNFI